MFLSHIRVTRFPAKIFLALPAEVQEHQYPLWLGYVLQMELGRRTCQEDFAFVFSAPASRILQRHSPSPLPPYFQLAKQSACYPYTSLILPRSQHRTVCRFGRAIGLLGKFSGLPNRTILKPRFPTSLILFYRPERTHISGGGSGGDPAAFSRTLPDASPHLNKLFEIDSHLAFALHFLYVILIKQKPQPLRSTTSNVVSLIFSKKGIRLRERGRGLIGKPSTRSPPRQSPNDSQRMIGEVFG
jgi:hypothetical protein